MLPKTFRILCGTAGEEKDVKGGALSEVEG